MMKTIKNPDSSFPVRDVTDILPRLNTRGIYLVTYRGMKTLTAGENITLTDTPTTVIVSAGGGSGSANSVYEVADITGRNALEGMIEGDIAVIEDADGSANPGVSFYTGDAWTDALVVSTGGGLYSGNGTVPTTTVATVTDTLSFAGAVEVTMGNYSFDTDQTVGVGQDGFILRYDDTGGQISLEAPPAGTEERLNTGTQAGITGFNETLYGTAYNVQLKKRIITHTITGSTFIEIANPIGDIALNADGVPVYYSIYGCAATSGSAGEARRTIPIGSLGAGSPAGGEVLFDYFIHDMDGLKYRINNTTVDGMNVTIVIEYLPA